MGREGKRGRGPSSAKGGGSFRRKCRKMQEVMCAVSNHKSFGKSLEGKTNICRIVK